MQATLHPPRHDPTDLVRAHQAEVWRYLRLLGAPAALADDLTQETFLSVLQRPFEDRGPAAAAAYLRLVARHLFLKDRRAAALRPQPMELAELDAAFARLCGADGGDGYLAQLGQCLERLAERSREALTLHRERQDEIGLVLLDLNMPGLLGDAVFRSLRRADPKLPILLSSGYPEQEALQRLADAGPIAFVQKPYRTAALLAAVRRALGGALDSSPA